MPDALEDVGIIRATTCGFSEIPPEHRGRCRVLFATFETHTHMLSANRLGNKFIIYDLLPW